MVRRALRDRRYRTLFLIDLSVPRNIEPAIADLEDAYLFNIDDLSKVVEQGRAARERAAEAASALVEQEADQFLATLRAVDVNDQLRSMSARAEEVRAAEIGRSRRLTESLDREQRDALERMTKALVKKLLHRPMKAIREAARAGDNERVRVLTDVWGDE